MTIIPRIIITPGEPAGIGPDVVIRMASQQWPAELIVVGSPALLTARARQLNLPLSLAVIDFEKPAEAHLKGQLKILPVELTVPSETGKLDNRNSGYVIKCLEIANDLCVTKQVDAIVTGPVQKSLINAANIAFRGHTEFFAERSHTEKSLMLFVIDDIKVALATTHLPLAKVAEAITQDNLEKTLRILHSELQKKFQINNPRILICGLNPHAGENGMLGREELEIHLPVIKKLRAENFNLSDPLPADTIFTQKHLQTADAILAMYHDQALPVVKYMGFDRAVNVTLGLPYIRTSVDHGTAVDIAGTDAVNPGSMIAAMELAIKLLQRAAAD